MPFLKLYINISKPSVYALPIASIPAAAIAAVCLSPLIIAPTYAVNGRKSVIKLVPTTALIGVFKLLSIEL